MKAYIHALTAIPNIYNYTLNNPGNQMKQRQQYIYVIHAVIDHHHIIYFKTISLDNTYNSHHQHPLYIEHLLYLLH